MLEKVKNILVDGKTYYLVADFYYKSTGSKRAVTTLIDKIPSNELIYDRKRGRGAGCYSSIDGLKKLVLKLPRFPIEVKSEIGVFEMYTSEQEFEYVIGGFVKSICLQLNRQVPIDKYLIDFTINDIAIEFQEQHHSYDEDVYANKYKAIESKYRKLLFFNSCDNVGSFIALLNKEIE